MKLFDNIKEEYHDAVSDIETYNEPYKSHALTWLTIGKVGFVGAAVDVVGISTANIALGFEQHQQALQHTLGNIQLYGFVGCLGLTLATVAGLGWTEIQNRNSE